MASLDARSLQDALEAADQAGVRLEMVDGIPVWEAFPSPRHQIALKRIEATVRPIGEGSECGCWTYQDMYVRFPDGSFKRPDLAIYCDPVPETDEATTMVPLAVVEVLSPGYERKDTDVGAPFYLRAGVMDVVLFDPRSGAVVHLTERSRAETASPCRLELECGCAVTF